MTESAAFVVFPAAIHSLFRRNVIGASLVFTRPSLDLNQIEAEAFVSMIPKVEAGFRKRSCANETVGDYVTG
jgi:hypothetical protein